MEDITDEIIWISQSVIVDAKRRASPTEDELPTTKRAKLVCMDKSIFSKSQDITTDKGCFDLEGGNNCKKTQNHSNYIPFVDFNFEHLPENFQDPLLVELVKVLGSLVVMLNVSFASTNRPQHFPGTNIKYPSSCQNGSGRIIFSERKKGTVSNHCPCLQCHESKQRKQQPCTEWGEIKVATAAHVVYDDMEAKNSICILNFNTEDRNGVQEFKYLRTADNIDVKNDRSVIIFVTHNVDLTFNLMKAIYAYKNIHEKAYDKYKSITNRRNSEYQLNIDSNLRTKEESIDCSNSSEQKGDVKVKENSDKGVLNKTEQHKDIARTSAEDETKLSGNNLAILVSHPHGWSKKVSIGTFQRRVLETDYFKRREYTYYEYVLSSCSGSSGAPVYILGKKNVWTNHPHSRSNLNNEGASAVEYETI